MDYSGEVFNYNTFTTSDKSYHNELFSFPQNNSNYVNTDSLDIKYDLGISIVNFNARSLVAHFDDIILILSLIKVLLFSNFIDIIYNMGFFPLINKPTLTYVSTSTTNYNVS